jgi:hypothetical protein
MVFTTCYVMQRGAKAGHTVGIYSPLDVKKRADREGKAEFRKSLGKGRI